MTQMKEQIKTPEKEVNEIEISNLPDAEFKNNGYQNAQRTHQVLQQHKKDPGRNEVYTKRNKEKFTGSQEWSG